jgi:hypothetical protein
MAQSNIDIKIIAEFLGKSAFKQADTAANKLNKTVKSLGQSFGVAFGGAALGYAIKSTIRDFADAQRETQQLTNTVKNLGLAFAAPEIDAYVESIGKLYGVTGDQAVPAMQALLTATGSVSRSTKIMNVALDLAASRNADVASVAKDLASAYVGNTKGLNQYKLGLTKAELAALSFDEILEKIGSQTLGSADEAAKTLSGQLAILSEVTNQAKERIGGGLVEALGGLAGENGAGGAAKTIENLSVKLTNAITGFGYLIKEVKIAQPILVAAGIAIGLAWAPWLTGIAAAALAIGAIGNAMKGSAPKAPLNTGNLFNQGKLFFPTGGDAGYKERLAAERKAEAAAAARAKKLEAMTKASTKAQKDALKIAKAKAVFDLQKIQIEAALKGKISEEDKIRLKLMQAIEEENLTNVEKYQKALEKAQEKTKELTELLATVKTLELKDPFGLWKVDPLTASINALTASMFAVQTQIQANGREWSSFANSVATTVIRPNLTEWSSSYSTASANAAAATAAANAALTATTTAASKAAAEAAASSAAAIAASNKTASEATASAAAASAAAIAASNKTASEATASAAAASAAAIAAANKASADAIAKAQAEAATTLGKLNAETAASTAAAAKAAQDAIDAANKTAAETVAAILAKASAEAAAKAATAAAANVSTLEAFKAAEAAAAQAAAAATATAGSTPIAITVNTGIGDPNAIAEEIQKLLQDAANRGVLIGGLYAE